MTIIERPSTHQLRDGFYAVKYSASGWTIYHKNGPRQAVWHTTELSEAMAWSRLGQLKAYAEAHNHRAAITHDGWLEVYIEWTAPSPFGQQNGVTVERIRTMRELKGVLGY